MLAVPDHTPYDLRFRLGAFPVRIHPLFWLMAAVVGWSTRVVWGNPALLLWVGCVLVSVLVHELGHAAVAWATGRRPAIVLWLMGGLCVYDPSRERPWQRFWVLVWGPGAGFVLAALVFLAGRAAYGLTAADQFALLGWRIGTPSPALFRFFFGHPGPRLLITHFLFEINIYWGLLNLLPIYPLDGGQITAVLANQVSPRHGMRFTHILSAVVAGAIAVYALAQQDYFRFFFLGSFAGYNVRLLLDLRERGYAGYGDPDAADWWKQ